MRVPLALLAQSSGLPNASPALLQAMPETDAKRKAILKIRSMCQEEFRAAAVAQLAEAATKVRVDGELMKMSRRLYTRLPAAVQQRLQAGLDVPVEVLRDPRVHVPLQVPTARPAALASQGSASSLASSEGLDLPGSDLPDKSQAPNFTHRIKGQLACAKKYRPDLMQDHFAADDDFA